MLGGKMMRGKMLRPTGGDNDDDDDSDSSSDDSSNESEEGGGGGGEVDSKVSSDKTEAQPANNASLKAKSANLSDDDSEDSDDDDDDDEEEEDNHGNKASAKRARQDSDEDDDSEDEDDEDDEEEEENERSAAPKSKKKRPKISFIDDEAEASDDDTDDEKLRNKDISREYIDKEAEAIMAQQDRRRQREKGWLDNLGRLTDDKEKDDSDVARIARELEERHRRERRIIPRGGGGVMMGGERGGIRGDSDSMSLREREEFIAEGGSTSYTAVSQQSLVPSVSDPNLWMFSCPGGKEQELVYQIMNKCVAFAKRGKPLGIISVVAAQTKGKIYVESFSEPAVMEAVQGVRGVMQYSMTKVPISDMTTVMTVVPKKVPGE
jgi:transcription elongation factor SPT5